MKCLLDTNIFIWGLDFNSPLPNNIRKIIEDKNNEIYFSVVSSWEISIKSSINKLNTPNNIKQVLEEADYKILGINLEHTLEVRNLPLIHRDPFDRLLIAQARIENLTLITFDKIISKYKVKLLKNF